MKFEVKCERSENSGNDAQWETRSFVQFQEALAYIESVMAEWNNFYPHAEIRFSLRKIPDGGESLGVNVHDTLDVRAVLVG